MSSTIGNFYQRVSRAIRRGTKYDADIPGYASDAVRELENFHNWKYMYREAVAVIEQSTTNNTLEVEDLKEMRSMDILDSAGLLIPIRKTRRENVLQIASGRPGAWWVGDQGNVTKDYNLTSIRFDAYPDQDYNVRVIEYKYTPRLLTDDLAWLELGDLIVVAKAILLMQPILRDDKLVQRWGKIEERILPGLLEADLMTEYDGGDDQMVPFTMEVEEDIAERATFE